MTDILRQGINAKGEPWWFLDGVPITGGHVVRVLDSLELHGVIRLDGDGPPGVPWFEADIEGVLGKTPIDIGKDQFRWPTDRERQASKLGKPFQIQRTH